MKTKVNDLTVYYETAGEGRPLLLLHGNGGSHKSFDGVLDALCARYRCYAVDTRWHGGTSRGSLPMSYVQFGSDLISFVSELGLEKPHIIGYSDGGITALEYAAHTRNVGRIVTLGANWDAGGTTEEFLAYARGVAKRAERFRWWPGAGRRRALMKLMLDPEAYDNWESLGYVACPVLLMTGDRDVIPPAHTERIHAALPTSRVFVVPDCGHAIMREQREIFLRETLAFLAAGDPPGKREPSDPVG